MPILTDAEKTKLVRIMNDHIPHTASLGIELHNVVGEELTFKMPYRKELVGDAEAGTFHGGALTVLLDHTLGMSTVCSDSMPPSVTPTLDLRIDHLGIAPPHVDIYATAKVYKATRKLIFVEGVAYYDSRDNPIASATGSWVRVADVDLTWILGAAQQ